MEKFRVEDVFKTEGIPEITFVEPLNYGELLVDFRNVTKPVVIEGQTGTGKTVTALKLIDAIFAGRQVHKLSGRIPANKEKLLSIMKVSGDNDVIFLDDFHRFDNDIQKIVGDVVKHIAEGGAGTKTKYIIAGINEVGKGLIQLTPDLLKRVGVHRIKSADEAKTNELIQKGASKLNIKIENSKSIFEESYGDYYLIQKLCQTLCIENRIFETMDVTQTLNVNVLTLRRTIIAQLSNGYEPAVIDFCRGRRFRPGNITYFKLLKAISSTGENTLNLEKLAADFPEIKSSVDQLKTRRLSILIDEKEAVKKYFYYNSQLKQFAIEDPAMGYFVKNLDWSRIEKLCGFRLGSNKFDIAVSFAGSSRTFVEYIVEKLKENDVNVFYDKDYEAKYLGHDMRDVFKKIYSEDSKIVVAFIDDLYLERVWPQFEKECFEHRVKNNEVIPVFMTETPVKGIPDSTWGIKQTLTQGDEDWKTKADYVFKKLFDKLNEIESS